MSTSEIIQQIQILPISDRLLIIEQVLHNIREKSLKSSEDELEFAAHELLNEYRSDTELTVFTAIDGEEFYEKK